MAVSKTKATQDKKRKKIENVKEGILEEGEQSTDTFLKDCWDSWEKPGEFPASDVGLGLSLWHQNYSTYCRTKNGGALGEVKLRAPSICE